MEAFCLYWDRAITGREEAELTEAEKRRREEEATRDLAATARYHADRLPLDSEWREPFIQVASSLPPTASRQPVGRQEPQDHEPALPRS